MTETQWDAPEITDQAKSMGPVMFAGLMRKDLKLLETRLRRFIKELHNFPTNPEEDRGEVIAQAKLGLRHLEDVRMRFWKVIQYAGDWVSKYDK